VAHHHEEAPVLARPPDLGRERVHVHPIGGEERGEVDDRDAVGLGDGRLGAVLGGLHERLVHGEAAHGRSVAGGEKL
jgi:hypothetical protein